MARWTWRGQHVALESGEQQAFEETRLRGSADMTAEMTLVCALSWKGPVQSSPRPSAPLFRLCYHNFPHLSHLLLLLSSCWLQ